MKLQDIRGEFVILRAEGLSYSAIAEKLHLSKSTCSKWERELAGDITRLKQERLNELYEAYGMAKEGRIRRLGDTINRIATALENVDLEQIPPDKLLKLQLEYTEALKKEYAGGPAASSLKADHTPEAILAAFGDLFDRLRAGEITGEQAANEGRTLTNLLSAHDAVKNKERLAALEAIVGGRPV